MIITNCNAFSFENSSLYLMFYTFSILNVCSASVLRYLKSTSLLGRERWVVLVRLPPHCDVAVRLILELAGDLQLVDVVSRADNGAQVHALVVQGDPGVSLVVLVISA